MKRLVLIGAMFAVPHLAHANVITEVGIPTFYGQIYDGFEIAYTFAPIAVPGQITNVLLTFSGYVTPGVGGAIGAVSSVTITPRASLSNSNLPGNVNAIPLPPAGVKGTAETLPLQGIGATPQFLRVSTSAGVGFPANVFALSSVELVTLFTELSSYSGPGVFPENRDRTTGIGPYDACYYLPASSRTCLTGSIRHRLTGACWLEAPAERLQLAEHLCTHEQPKARRAEER